MIEFKLNKLCVEISFSFFAMLSLIMYFKDYRIALLALLTCLLHEIGHLSAMQLFGVGINKIAFYGGGIKIFSDTKNINSFSKDIFILLSGSLFNFLLAVVSYFTSEKLMLFSIINVLIGCFNLLPFSYFDGGNILKKFSDSNSSVCACILIYFFRVAVSVMFLSFSLILYIKGRGNISLLITTLYITISEFLLF